MKKSLWIILPVLMQVGCNDDVIIDSTLENQEQILPILSENVMYCVRKMK